MPGIRRGTFSYKKEVFDWKPDASRTLLYLPLESNATDYSWNSRWTSPSNITYASLWGIMCANANWSNSKIQVTPNWFCNYNNDTYWTISMLVYLRSLATSWAWTKWIEFAIQNKTQFVIWWGWFSEWLNKRLHVVSVRNKTDWTHKYYINWELSVSETLSDMPRWKWPNSYEQGQYLFCSRWGNNNRMNWWMRELIIENVLWSDEYIANYYKWIKNKLWF